MRNSIWILAAIVTVLLPVRLLLGQWGRGSACAVAQQPAAKQQAEYVWVKNPKMPGEIYLFQHGRQIGGYSYQSGFYLPLKDGVWGPPAKAPIPPPLEGMKDEKGKTLFGVVPEKISQVEHFECRDKVHDRESAYALLEATVPDDTTLPSFTCVARDGRQASAIARDWNSAAPLEKFRRGYRAQFYDGSSPITREILSPFRLADNNGYQKSGLVMFAQGPPGPGDGKAAVNQWFQYDGPELLADALRKVDPNFDPNKIPLPVLPALPAFSSEQMMMAAAAVCVVLLLLFRPRGG